jgi:predicted GNAT superfamily acetyltransferase
MNYKIRPVLSSLEQSMCREILIRHGRLWVQKLHLIFCRLCFILVPTYPVHLLITKLVGAAFAFPATNNGLHLHSHMTAVLPEFRDKGVGYALKIDQWNWAKKNTYSHLSWTFDPLVRRNAKLNIVKLGVDISDYFPNFYGDMPDALNAGDESDRLMVFWRTDLDAPKARELITNPEPGDILIEIPAGHSCD